jgi:hypothetical protein
MFAQRFRALLRNVVVFGRKRADLLLFFQFHNTTGCPAYNGIAVISVKDRKQALLLLLLLLLLLN